MSTGVSSRPKAASATKRVKHEPSQDPRQNRHVIDLEMEDSVEDKVSDSLSLRSMCQDIAVYFRSSNNRVSKTIAKHLAELKT